VEDLLEKEKFESHFMPSKKKTVKEFTMDELPKSIKIMNSEDLD
jgi:hypothetical protein